MRASRGGVAAAVAVASMAGTSCANDAPSPASGLTSTTTSVGAPSMDAGLRWLLDPRPDCAPPFPIGTRAGAELLASTSTVPGCREGG
jgi:hypothetical protein